MDPYCIITYNGVEKQSKVIKGAGLNPNWKESFMFNLTSKPSSIKVEVYDKETFKKDDFVGSGTMMVEENRLMKVPIFEDKKEAGIVFVVIDSKV
jgi:Ca2+-dependent lipid-binding protein